MLSRCENPKHRAYPRYGGRGIRVCERWRSSFEAFAGDVGPRPPGVGPTGRALYSLDRYPNNDGNYEPGNVRWATAEEQARGKRNVKLLTYRGRDQTLAEWVRELGLGYRLVICRLYKGWGVVRAFEEPARPHRTRGK